MLQKRKSVKWFRVTIIACVLVVVPGLLFINSYSFIKHPALKITMSEKIKSEVTHDAITLYIPINADVSKYKIWLGSSYFDKDTTIASKLLNSLDTSIPNEVITTVVLERDPVTLHFIVE